FALAHAMIGRTYISEGYLYRTLSIAEAASRAERYCRRALNLDPNDPDVLAVMALNLYMQGELEPALVLVDRSLSRNRNLAIAHRTRGNILIGLGRFDSGREEILASIRLNPRDPGVATCFTSLAQSY